MTIRPHPDPTTPDAAWRDVPVLGFTVAAGIAVLFCLVWLLRDGLTTDYTWGCCCPRCSWVWPGRR